MGTVATKTVVQGVGMTNDWSQVEIVVGANGHVTVNVVSVIFVAVVAGITLVHIVVGAVVLQFIDVVD